jgi:glycosyltransferase involved in cell wall biosynthesis
LCICGEGSFKNVILEYAKKDNRINYLGLLKREQVLLLQQKATILINPRNSNEEYTKYSFPSKTMEYMASGTPVVMFKLPGMPEEYVKYLGIIEDDSLETLQKTIVEWCEKSSDELYEFGNTAREFILKHKNAKIQTARIIDFLKEK